MKTTEELRKLDAGKLQNELIESIQKLRKAEFEEENATDRDTSKKGKTRRYIARIKTIQKEQPKN